MEIGTIHRVINPNIVDTFEFDCFICHVSCSTEGAHLNPAVSLAMAVGGKFPFKKVAFYWVAQYLGAFAAAASVFGVYNGKVAFPPQFPMHSSGFVVQMPSITTHPPTQTEL